MCFSLIFFKILACFFLYRKWSHRLWKKKCWSLRKTICLTNRWIRYFNSIDKWIYKFTVSVYFILKYDDFLGGNIFSSQQEHFDSITCWFGWGQWQSSTTHRDWHDDWSLCRNARTAYWTGRYIIWLWQTFEHEILEKLEWKISFR